MLDKIKEIDKRFLYAVGALFGFVILLIVIFLVMKLFSGPGKNYNKVEDKLKSAAKAYLEENPSKAPAVSENITLESSTLIAEGHMKELTEYLDDTCSSATVLVMNNGGYYLYLPNLVCSGYSTQHLSTKIIDDHLVANSENPYEDGLYEVENEFIFKGKNVDNYVSFGGLVWRIIKIDENGNLRLIKNSSERSKKQWDNKYNVELGKSYGINDYEHSLLVETLNESYEGVSDKNKVHIIPHEVCVGKRGKKDTTLSYDVDCAEKISGQYMSVVNTLDFPMASLDENCTEVGAGSCVNYNYLDRVISSSWTSIGNADNTYEVFNISGGYSNVLPAKNNLNYSWVIYISGQEPYKSGTGTEEDPYVIG